MAAGSVGGMFTLGSGGYRPRGNEENSEGNGGGVGGGVKGRGSEGRSENRD